MTMLRAGRAVSAFEFFSLPAVLAPSYLLKWRPTQTNRARKSPWPTKRRLPREGLGSPSAGVRRRPSISRPPSFPASRLRAVPQPAAAAPLSRAGGRRADAAQIGCAALRLGAGRLAAHRCCAGGRAPDLRDRLGGDVRQRRRHRGDAGPDRAIGAPGRRPDRPRSGAGGKFRCRRRSRRAGCKSSKPRSPSCRRPPPRPPTRRRATASPPLNRSSNRSARRWRRFASAATAPRPPMRRR